MIRICGCGQAGERERDKRVKGEREGRERELEGVMVRVKMSSLVVEGEAAAAAVSPLVEVQREESESPLLEVQREESVLFESPVKVGRRGEKRHRALRALTYPEELDESELRKRTRVAARKDLARGEVAPWAVPLVSTERPRTGGDGKGRGRGGGGGEGRGAEDAPASVVDGEGGGEGGEKTGDAGALLGLASARLHMSYVPGSLACREAEVGALTSAVLGCVERGQGGCVYVSGAPGCGKSTALGFVLDGVRERPWAANGNRVAAAVNVNCMRAGLPERPRGVWRVVLEELGWGSTGREFEDERRFRDRVIRPRAKGNANADSGMVVLVLDEVDQLVQAKGESDVLYDLFTLASTPDSRLVLLGVANRLDLTERVLPRLRLRNCLPKHVVFAPYRVEQVLEALKQRVEEADAEWNGTGRVLVCPRALELCARKVAANTGDMRKALEGCRAAMGLAAKQLAAARSGGREDDSCDEEGETEPVGGAAENGGAVDGGMDAEMERMLNENPNAREDTLNRSPQKAATTAAAATPAAAAERRTHTPSPAVATPSPAGPIVTVVHMAKVLSAGFSSATVETVRGLPRQLQLVLCAAMQLAGEGKAAPPPVRRTVKPNAVKLAKVARAAPPPPRRDARPVTLGELRDRYAALCKRTGVTPLGSGVPFVEALQVLEGQALLDVKQGKVKEVRGRKVTLTASRDDVLHALSSIRLLSDLLV